MATEYGGRRVKQKDNRIPCTQFGSGPLIIAQAGSGTVIQPFRTAKDYSNWINHATAFSTWPDSAIVYFKKGIAEGIEALPTEEKDKVYYFIDMVLSHHKAKKAFAK